MRIADRAPRVLQVVLSLDPGGTERLVLELVERLESVTPMAVCCLDSGGAWAHQLRECGVTVTALNRSSGFRPLLARQVAQVARDHRADVIHAHHYSPFVYSALSQLWNSSPRIIFTEHGRLANQVPSAKRRVANAVLRKTARHVVAVSQDLRGHLGAEGFPLDSVRVIYNGISVGPRPGCGERQQVRAELGVGDGTLVVGTIARLDPVKDLGSLITAINLLAGHLPPEGGSHKLETNSIDRGVRLHAEEPDPNPRSFRLQAEDVRLQAEGILLLVIGEGPERAQLEKLAATVGDRAKVIFLGQRDDARRWLAGCDIYVNSSISEGVSLTILEAMAAALPVVATRVGGTPEVVDTECGRLVPASNPQALAEAMRDLAADRPLARRLGDAARKRVEEQFSIERMVSAYNALYRETT